MINRIYSHFWDLRKKISRKHLSVRLLGKPYHLEKAAKPGVVMLQIDGLSHEQFQKALKKNRLPFVKGLVEKNSYTALPFYSGLPSATPAVQGEIFYGVKTSVPAFDFILREEGERFTMFMPHAAAETARTLEKEAAPLLKGGTSYSNIFSAGAAEGRYCAETLNIESILKSVNPMKILVILLVHITKFFRVGGYALVETIIAVSDFFQGIMERKHVFKELKFIFARISICIVMRELIRFHVKMDVARGVKIVHANLIGYDEQAHRRGPSSAFAHWTLKGIDDVIKDVYNAARQSECRDYRVVIYSDHGQETVESFEKTNNLSVKDAIRAVVSETAATETPDRQKQHISSLDYLYERAGYMLFRKETKQRHPVPRRNGRIEVTAMGPLGHIYLPSRPDDTQMMATADQLVKSAGIPLVLFKHNGSVTAVNRKGAFDLAVQSERILGKHHPFLQETARDFIRLCQHKDAGDYVISGWRSGEMPLSFAVENGAHGGPGSEETRGFALLPQRFKPNTNCFRGINLKKYVEKLLVSKNSRSGPKRDRQNDHSRLRVVSYNIHSCINMDGRVFPDRIARVIDRLEPDIAALQEVDFDMRRTLRMNQARYLARQLQMNCSFFPVVTDHRGMFGLAVLSRYPIQDVAYRFLPGLVNRYKLEPRGVMAVKVITPAAEVWILNTHLSFINKECCMQAKALNRTQWISEANKQPSVLCGDLNAGPRSTPYQTLSPFLRDVQLMNKQTKRTFPTFFSRYPLMRIDHIFVSRHFDSLHVGTPCSYDARMASDHLPVAAEICLKSDAVG